ncbi:MAG: hypothetical protein JNJ54_04560 [Myxococcaceae bacterium]|nr:hypothetical protein [Myxococcaceae bacterium]
MPPEIAATLPTATPTDEAFTAQCDADYVSAEITAIAHLGSEAGTLTHLLAVVELLHGELEANPLIGLGPKAGGYPRSVDLGKRGGRILLQKWTSPVRAALDWYRGCAGGEMLVPGPRAPTRVQLGQLGSDPPWPHLVVEVEDFWEHSQFWGDRPGGSRWHRLLPLVPVEITTGWEVSDYEKAREFLMAEAHIDLLSRSTLLGSCHLRLPNPVYRRLHQHVGDDWKSITFEVVPFPNRANEPLELTFWNRRAWGATEVRRLPLHAGPNVLNIPEGVEQVAHAVVSPTRGLLEQSEVAGFIASMRVEMNLVTEQRRIQGPPRTDGGASRGQTVGVVGHSSVMEIGDARPVEALSRLATDEDQQNVKKAWSRLSVQWFDRDKTAGTQAVRDIIGTASKRLHLLDPYFGASDIAYALGTTRHGLPIRILTSHDFCTTRNEDLGVENGEVLLRTLDTVLAQDSRFKIEIKVMAGGKSPVHDRFLIVDDAVWLLGASLNEFGSRGTLLLRLPASPKDREGSAPSFSVSRDVFDEHWSRPPGQSTPLRDWVKQRAADRTGAQVPPAPKSITDRVNKTKTLLAEALRRIREVWRA